MNRNAVTVDFHAHAMVEEVEALVRANPRWSDEMKRPERPSAKPRSGAIGN
jgi:hypothetical protein